jgi:hypothetical protein
MRALMLLNSCRSLGGRGAGDTTALTARTGALATLIGLEPETRNDVEILKVKFGVAVAWSAANPEQGAI